MNGDLETSFWASQSFWGCLGLCSFTAIFLAVCVYAFSRKNQGTFVQAANLPLENDG